MRRRGEYSGALRRRCADLHSRRAQGTQGHCWTEAFATVSKKFSTNGDRLGTSEVGCVATGGRRHSHSVAEAHSTPSRKGLAARRVPTLQTFPSPFPVSVRCNTTLPRNHTCTNEPCRQSNPCVLREKRRTRDQRNHCRSVAWVSSAGKRGTHRISTSVCLWCCGKSYAYNHIANALRETWGNDDRLRSHDIALSQQLQVAYTGQEEDDWQETDYDYEDSLEPWTSEWYNTDGYDDETYPHETDWTEDYYDTDDYDPNDSTLSDHCPALLDQTVETQEGDTSKLETVQEAVAAANAAADMSPNLDSRQTAHERCA